MDRKAPPSSRSLKLRLIAFSKKARYKRGRVANDDARPSPLSYSGKSEIQSDRAVFIMKYGSEKVKWFKAGHVIEADHYA